ncbi:hypothetical protein [Pseudophaeobacter sp.]|uniref:hypothetical protein n=1 Tax=Pseudophaeobacter sp. TaxID=1971739 RepID=UPI00405A2316
MKTLLATGLLILSAAAATAAPKAYLCTYVDNTGNTGLHEKAVYVIDEALGTAMAFDPYIRNTSKSPIATSLKVLKPGRYLMKWSLNDIPVRSSNSTLRGSFSSRLDANKMTSTISVTIHGGDRPIRGSGSCSMLED